MFMETQQALLKEKLNKFEGYDQLLSTNGNGSKVNNYKVLNEVDWDFKDFQTQYLTHRFHSYPARFIPQIPKTFIKLFTKEGDTVVDPMCGCGTAVVEAFLAGRDSIGNDFNPLACLITKVKARLISEVELNVLRRKLIQIKRYVDSDHRRYEYLRKLPKRNISNLFNRDMINELCLIKEGLEEIKDKKAAYELALVALSGTIWCIIESNNGIDIFANFYKKICNMTNIIVEMRRKIEREPAVEVICGDARKLQIESRKSSLIVTSPPYVNALDYYRVHMYNMLWLGMDFGIFKKHEIGGHSHFIANRFRLLTEYIADMTRSMIEMNRVLRGGGLCVIAIGNSSLEYERIESYKHFIAISKYLDFKLIKTIFRNIDTTRKYTSRDIGKIDDEYIVVLEKQKDLKGVSSEDDGFVEEIVTKQMKEFEKQVIKNPGSSLRGKEVSQKRLEQNAHRIAEAIKTISEDIKIKE